MSGDGREGGAGITGLAHLGIAVQAADPLAELFVRAFGAERAGEEILDGGALRIVFLRLGPVTFELLEPRSGDHTVARYLANRGEGMHHVSLEVADIEDTLAQCAAAGVRLIDERPRAGAHGTRVAFLHPKSLGGVLIELCETKEPPA